MADPVTSHLAVRSPCLVACSLNPCIRWGFASRNKTSGPENFSSFSKECPPWPPAHRGWLPGFGHVLGLLLSLAPSGSIWLHPAGNGKLGLKALKVLKVLLRSTYSKTHYTPSGLAQLAGGLSSWENL